MSELKATTAQEIVRNEKDCDYMDELFGGVKMPPTQVYLKYEADKVIAELKDKALQYKVLYKEMCRDINSQEQHFAKQLYHHKYKRCLAMAKWCHDKWNMSLGWDPTEGDTAHFFLHYQKWEKRWLGLAKKFKDKEAK